MNVPSSFYVFPLICTGVFLLTCRIVNPRVDVIWRGYGWFSERVNVVVGCSDVALRPNGSLWVALAFYHESERCGSG